MVRDPVSSGGTDDEGQIEFTPPAVEFTVHNGGTRRSVITRLVMTIEDSTVIEQCAADGAPVAVSASYDVTLPLRPADGTELQVPVSQQQRPDEADRFAVRIGTPEPGSRTTVHLYRVRFELVVGGAPARVPAGTAVVAAPMAPLDGDGYFWSETYDSGEVVFDPYPGLERDIACMRRNSGTLQEFLAGGAELSPELAESKSVMRL
ncbi:hypothetical protein AB0J80_21740 [Actinoplanes sp. NPDC049548]|uniref:hypothetical protein n=1 Tax=Actinoplanes sp. NPDC049548 TaxID=3155152 RepID=UPI00343A80CF